MNRLSPPITEESVKRKYIQLSMNWARSKEQSTPQLIEHMLLRWSPDMPTAVMKRFIVLKGGVAGGHFELANLLTPGTNNRCGYFAALMLAAAWNSPNTRYILEAIMKGESLTKLLKYNMILTINNNY